MTGHLIGPSQALSGTAVRLAGTWTLDHFAGTGSRRSPLAAAVGATVCAGGALRPFAALA